MVTIHDLWHIAVLLTTLLAAAGIGVLLLAPLLFDEPPKGLAENRRYIWGLVVVAGVLLVVEWQAVHGG